MNRKGVTGLESLQARESQATRMKSSPHTCYLRPSRPSSGPCPASAFPMFPASSGSSTCSTLGFLQLLFSGPKTFLLPRTFVFLFTFLTLTCHSGLNSDVPSSGKLSLTSQAGPDTSPGLPQIPKCPSAEPKSLGLSFPVTALTTVTVAD